jgi:predicted small secreted protein
MRNRMKSSRVKAEARTSAPAGVFSLSAVFALLAIMLLSGCNTMEGLGRDIGVAGDTLADTAQEVEEEM